MATTVPISNFTQGASAPAIGINGDVNLWRDAANTLALRNGVNIQGVNIYKTFTDASNYEKIAIGTDLQSGYFGASVHNIVSLAAGTGTARTLAFSAGASGGFVWVWTDGSINFGRVGNFTSWQMTTAGHFVGVTDNTYDIGAAGATRPRTGYFATSVVAPAFGAAISASTFLNLPAGTTAVSPLRFIQGAAPTAPVDGDMWREDNTNTGVKIRINGVTKTVTVS